MERSHCEWALKDLFQCKPIQKLSSFCCLSHSSHYSQCLSIQWFLIDNQSKPVHVSEVTPTTWQYLLSLKSSCWWFFKPQWSSWSVSAFAFAVRSSLQSGGILCDWSRMSGYCRGQNFEALVGSEGIWETCWDLRTKENCTYLSHCAVLILSSFQNLSQFHPDRLVFEISAVFLTFCPECYAGFWKIPSGQSFSLHDK